MRGCVVALLSGSLMLSACANGDGSINWGKTIAVGVGAAAAGAGLYYLSRKKGSNRDDGADYCAQRYTGKALRQCIASLPGR